MTNPTHSQEQDLRTALEAERAELQKANDEAPGWGAAVGARAERIREIDSRLAAPPRPVDAERVALGTREIIVEACFDPGHFIGARGSRTTDEWRADAVLAALASPAHSPDKAADEDARLSLSGNPMPPDGIEGCCICGEAFKEGDMVLIEVNEGEAHVACCGPERDGYVNLDTGEPIGPDEPIPAGYPWSAHSPDKAVTREGVAEPCEPDWPTRVLHDIALAPKTTGTEAGRGVVTDWPGVDGHVVQAARDLCAERRGQPEWLWFENEHGRVSFGRWPKLPTQAPYVRADIPLAATPTPPVSPTPDSTGPAGAKRRPISEAPTDGTRLLCLTILRTTQQGEHPEWNVGHFDEDAGAWFSEEGSDIHPAYFYALPDWRSPRRAALTPSAPIAAPVREALKKAVSGALYKNQFKRDWRELIDPVVEAILAALTPSAPIADQSPDSTGQGDAQTQEGWRPISTAPKDGTPIWAYLYDSGIREVSWWSAEAIAEDMGGRPEQYQEGFYEGRSQDEWRPRWWLPLDALPDAPPAPADRSEGGRNV